MIEITAHIKKEGSALNNWYAGITSDIESRLFGAHKVPRKNHWFIFREATSARAAREIEDALLKAGLDGNTGGGDDASTYVYCYKKTSITEP